MAQGIMINKKDGKYHILVYDGLSTFPCLEYSELSSKWEHDNISSNWQQECRERGYFIWGNYHFNVYKFVKQAIHKLPLRIIQRVYDYYCSNFPNYPSHNLPELHEIIGLILEGDAK